MGNCNDADDGAALSLDQWIQLSQDQHSVILKHPTKKLTVQKWTSLEIQNLNVYSWRLKAKNTFLPQIEEILEVDLPPEKSSKQYQKIKGSIVITQPLTAFSKLAPFTAGECALFMKGVLIGLKVLCEKFGWFNIDSEMLWVNQNGQPVIWMNPNLAMNKPKQKLSLDRVTQQSMVQRVFELLSSKMEPEQILQFPCYQMGFQKADAWLKKYMDLNCAKLTKIYVDRFQYNATQERVAYRNWSKGVAINISERVKVGPESTQSSWAIKLRHLDTQVELKEQRNLSLTNDDLKSSNRQFQAAKDPDEMLFELIQQYQLDKQ